MVEPREVLYLVTVVRKNNPGKIQRRRKRGGGGWGGGGGGGGRGLGGHFRCLHISCTVSVRNSKKQIKIVPG